MAEAKGWLENTLDGSALVPTFIDITEALPADALGFVPSDFRVALDILQEKIEGSGFWKIQKIQRLRTRVMCPRTRTNQSFRVSTAGKSE